MISLWIEQIDTTWFGVACHEDRLVATATGADRESAARALQRSLPPARPFRMDEEGSEQARRIVRLLARLEGGTAGGVTIDEGNAGTADDTREADAAGQPLAAEADAEGRPPSFDLCPDCVREPLRSVARAAAAIPRGFVTTYGNLAAAAGTEARVVGHIMATNPLYPIVPCHRVVGADFSLVGYTGSREEPALRVKLGRLRTEARGAAEARTVIPSPGSAGLTVYPVERVLERAVRDGLDPGGQLSLW